MTIGTRWPLRMERQRSLLSNITVQIRQNQIIFGKIYN
jgi:hypothetical protein